MITIKSLAGARVLIVGGGDLVAEILHSLKSYGVHNITLLDSLTAESRAEPLTLVRDDPKYFQSFDIVLSANQPRSFEVALSDLRWPRDGNSDDPDLPMIVMRNAANTVKMRCQYRELLVNENVVSRFVSLPMELLPWTEEKRALVLSTVREAFKPHQDLNFRAYLTAALAVINFQRNFGSWPTTKDEKTVESMAGEPRIEIQPKVKDFTQKFCEGGLAAVPETTAILAHLVTLDTIRLLTGNGQPINNTNLEEVIRILAEQSDQAPLRDTICHTK